MSVYFIRNETTGNVKIGYTSEYLEKRLEQIRSNNDCPVAVLALWPGAPMLAEKALHRELVAHHLHHEWFRDSLELRRIVGLGYQAWLAQVGPLTRWPSSSTRARTRALARGIQTVCCHCSVQISADLLLAAWWGLDVDSPP